MKREARVARTRAKIIEAARGLLVRAEFRGLALDDVARAAGVTRATVYNQFGNKVGLLEALFRDSGRRMDLPRRLRALAHPDPEVALRGLVRESVRGWARDRTVLQRVVALSAVDPDASGVLARFEGMRTHDAGLLVARLAAARGLARGTTVRVATSAIVVLTSFQIYDQLATTGLPLAAIVQTLTMMAETFTR